MLPSRDRIRGMFLGVAIGDALGVPVETFTAAHIERDYGRITTYLQNPTHKWSAAKPAGMWSDDTQLTLAVAESIIESDTLDLESQAKWHLRVLDEFGDLGLGGSTRDALNRIRTGVSPTDSGKTDNPKRGMGNALPMKISPVAPWMLSVMDKGDNANYDFLIDSIAALTVMTHRTDVALQSALAQVWALWICLTLRPESVDADTLCGAWEYALGLSQKYHLPGYTPLLALNLQSLRRLALDELSPAAIAERFHGGDQFLVRNSLPVAYACFLRHPASVEALYDAVAAGGDTDTNASIAGSLVGALNGTAVFPAHLIEGLRMRERILDTAERLCDRLGTKE